MMLVNAQYIISPFNKEQLNLKLQLSIYRKKALQVFEQKVACKKRAGRTGLIDAKRASIWTSGSSTYFQVKYFIHVTENHTHPQFQRQIRKNHYSLLHGINFESNCQVALSGRFTPGALCELNRKIFLAFTPFTYVCNPLYITHVIFFEATYANAYIIKFTFSYNAIKHIFILHWTQKGSLQDIYIGIGWMRYRDFSLILNECKTYLGTTRGYENWPE